MSLVFVVVVFLLFPFWNNKTLSTIGFGLGDALLRHLGSNWIAPLHGIIHRLHQHISNRTRRDGTNHTVRWNFGLLLYGESAIFASLLGEIATERETVIVGDEINYVIFIFNQYAGFLTIILVIELAIAASLYTYKDHLAVGLQQGLNNSIINYGPKYVMQSADFDAMQENVKLFPLYLVPLCGHKFAFLINAILMKLLVFLLFFAVGLLWECWLQRLVLAKSTAPGATIVLQAAWTRSVRHSGWNADLQSGLLHESDAISRTKHGKNSNVGAFLCALSTRRVDSVDCTSQKHQQGEVSTDGINIAIYHVSDSGSQFYLILDTRTVELWTFCTFYELFFWWLWFGSEAAGVAGDDARLFSQVTF